MAARVHPDLLDQMRAAGAAPVQAIFELRPAGRAAGLPPADECAKLAGDVLSRVASEVGHPPARVNVLRNIGTVVVEADPEFLRSLIHQPEVTSARPNKTTESPFIPPKGKRPA